MSRQYTAEELIAQNRPVGFENLGAEAVWPSLERPLENALREIIRECPASKGPVLTAEDPVPSRNTKAFLDHRLRQ